MKTRISVAAMFVGALLAGTAGAIPTITIERDINADREFATTWVFNTIPSNSAADLADASNGKSFVLLGGTQNGSSQLADLNNGVVQTGQDAPAESFFANDGQRVRVQVDLGASFSLTAINSFSWHTGVRTPQVYEVYGAADPTDNAPSFTDAAFRNNTALALLGYESIAFVNTQPSGNAQHGVSITGDIGTYRYVLFDMEQANFVAPSTNGNRGTFFGEIDIFGTPVIGIPEPATAGLAVLGMVALGRRRTGRIA